MPSSGAPHLPQFLALADCAVPHELQTRSAPVNWWLATATLSASLGKYRLLASCGAPQLGQWRWVTPRFFFVSQWGQSHSIS